MIRWRTGVLCLLIIAIGSSAHAFDPSQAFGIIQNQIDNELARRQQREFERQQKLQNQNLYNAFLAAWNDCFNARIVERCDAALQFQNVSANDQQRLYAQRAEIVAAIQAQQEEARRERAEQFERERQARIEAANEARRLQTEREQEAARQLQLEREALRAEAKQTAELRALGADFDMCRGYLIEACDRVLASQYSSRPEFGAVRGWRETAVAYRADRDACQSGSIEACDRALASPAVTIREKLVEWRTAASPVNRALATVAEYGALFVAMLQAIPTIIAELPLSTKITGGAASGLAMVLALVMLRRAPAAVTPSPTSIPLTATRPVKKHSSAVRMIRRTLRRSVIKALVWRRARLRAGAEKVAQPAPTHTLPIPVAMFDQPRDTETAVDAMQLAQAYVAEFQDTIGNAVDDPAFAARTLNTLSLISRQLDLAERADPAATLTIEDKDGTSRTLTVTTMKGNALYFEAMCRMTDNPKRAIQILEQCLQLVPDADNAYFWIGMLHADIFNKAAAIAAFEKALALDPRNLDYRKELGRAQTISGAQVAYDRAVTGTKTTINVARWIWTGFIVIALVSFVSAIIRGDPGPAIAIFGIFIIFGLFLRAIDAAKAFLGNTFKI